MTDINQLLILIGAVTVLISVAFNWLLKLKEQYTRQENNYQRLLMLSALAQYLGL